MDKDGENGAISGQRHSQERYSWDQIWDWQLALTSENVENETLS